MLTVNNFLKEDLDEYEKVVEAGHQFKKVVFRFESKNGTPEIPENLNSFSTITFSHVGFIYWSSADPISTSSLEDLAVYLQEFPSLEDEIMQCDCCDSCFLPLTEHDDNDGNTYGHFCSQECYTESTGTPCDSCGEKVDEEDAVQCMYGYYCSDECKADHYEE